MGIFYRLFTLLENSAHILDTEATHISSSNLPSSSASLRTFADSIGYIKRQLEDKMRVMEQLLTLFAVNSSTFTTTSILILATLQEIAMLKEEI